MKNIMTIGIEIPWHSDSYKPYRSNQSLLDADIILFEPYISGYGDTSIYQGKTCYGENSSFNLKEDTSHWRKELSIALENGKTIFIFLREYEDFFIHTGEKRFSGTGRNTMTTNIVTNSNNYEFLPIEHPSIIPKEGTSIKFVNSPLFSTYWQEFAKYSKFESYFEKPIGQPIFVTKTGEKVVGTVVNQGKGHLVILPPLRWDYKKFVHSTKTQESWTKEAQIFGENLFKMLVDIDDKLSAKSEETPSPPWIQDPIYEIENEKIIRTDISKITIDIDNLITKKNKLIENLEKEARIKSLLFEKGKPLERSIIEALRILGFEAENYNDGELEIDQVIISPENDRYIGEAEGKDSSAVNVEKIRQLMSNIQEDLAKEEVDKPSIGILFGNGFRLIAPATRQEQFTSKCLNTAKLQNIILIKTSDLFEVVKYIKKSDDKDFSKRCRLAIRKSQGKIVAFPRPKK